MHCLFPYSRKIKLYKMSNKLKSHENSAHILWKLISENIWDVNNPFCVAYYELGP